EGLGGLLAALEAQGQRPRRIFFVSSTSVYAQDGGERVDESSPAEPRRFNGRRLLEAETLLRASRFAGTVVRFAGIYGPGRTRLLQSVRRGEAPAAEGPPRYTNRIHRDDCAGMLDYLIGLAHAEPLYLGVDCEPVAEDRLLAWLAGALHVPAPPPGRADVEGFRGKRCDNARLLACGYAFRYPSYRDGYTALIRAEG
ncbi:MAG: SDR family NAD(P)-dependent oxidoreductase, partial [Myxococcales bacterium]|nr:SDR family NAD(P)-dependent oxidoreductase [Myxococcales bacterium]